MNADLCAFIKSSILIWMLIEAISAGSINSRIYFLSNLNAISEWETISLGSSNYFTCNAETRCRMHHFTRRSWRKIIGTPLNEDESIAEVEWDGDNKAWTRRNDSNNYCLASQLVRCAWLSSYNTQLNDTALETHVSYIGEEQFVTTEGSSYTNVVTDS